VARLGPFRGFEQPWSGGQLTGAVEPDTRRLLRISQVSAMFANPGLAKSDDVLSSALNRLQPRPAAIVGAVALVVLVALMVLRPF
jgi:hypothetical protein